MVLETNYQQAVQYLAKEKFDDALAIFTSLTKSKYKDSETMILETTYQKACLLYKNKKYLTAMIIIKRCGSYKDSATVKGNITQALYDEAVKFYRSKDYASARSNLNNIGSYKRSSAYLLLISAHVDYTYYDNIEKKFYNKLKALGDFEDGIRN